MSLVSLKIIKIVILLLLKSFLIFYDNFCGLRYVVNVIYSNLEIFDFFVLLV